MSVRSNVALEGGFLGRYGDRGGAAREQGLEVDEADAARHEVADDGMLAVGRDGHALRCRADDHAVDLDAAGGIHDGHFAGAFQHDQKSKI